jgi:2-polyprenyl-3-methyl-5-hydroxy-6-metoxy-1,4-benzoquinol methylase
MALLAREFFHCLTRRLALDFSADHHHEAAREFWESGEAEDEESHYWGAQPMVRRAINRRITGDPDVWPMEWFASRYASTPFAHGLSAGCGDGALERDILKKDICRTMEGIDFSREALRRAELLAEETGLSGRIRYRIANLDALALPAESYDIVFFHGSLHHVREVDNVLATVEGSLKRGGLLFLDEYTGPARHEWSDSLWRFAQSAFDSLPDELKNRPNLQIPLPMDDPSESIRSSAIGPALRERFEVLEDRPYGGNILWFTFPCLDMKALRHDGTGALSRLIALEDHLLGGNWVDSYFRILIARKR